VASTCHVPCPGSPRTSWPGPGSSPYPELAARILGLYAEGVFSPEELEEICRDAYDFPVPVEQVQGGRHLLRLDRGPTASFKDFAARFMGRAWGATSPPSPWMRSSTTARPW
jgi:threonine synthase